MQSVRRARGTAAALLAAAIVLGAASPALAVGNPRDESDAMRYGASAPLGSVIETLIGEDDATATYPAPWPLNFFGSKYEGICVTTNGGVYPVATDATTCSNDYDQDLENLALSSNAPMIAVLAADADLSACDAARIAERDGAGDGFGRPCTIYIDTTATVNGREAVVVTWYRVSQYDNANDPTLENTYQLALVKLPTADGDTLGYNFDLEFNYGTVMDPEDGYSFAAPADECVSLSDDCRWGIGIASYTPATEEELGPAPSDAESQATESEVTEPASSESGVDEQSAPLEPAAAAESAVGYEFFAPTEVADMMDNGATPLIANSLGTDVLGRYTCGMVNGAAVGCDPVEMQGAELAQTGPAEVMTAMTAAAAIIALGATVVVSGSLVRRSSRHSTASV